MMICAWGFIEIYSNSNDTKIFGARKKETQKGLPVARFNSDSGRHAEKSRMVAYTRKDIRLSCSCGSRCTWWCNYPRRYYCLRPWFSTISFPSMNSIFLYIIADLRRFVKEMGVLFTIRLRIRGEKDKNGRGEMERRATAELARIWSLLREGRARRRDGRPRPSEKKGRTTKKQRPESGALLALFVW